MDGAMRILYLPSSKCQQRQFEKPNFMAYFVLLEEKIRYQWRRRVSLLHVADAPVPLNQKIHLRAESRTGFFLVEVGEERIVLGVEDPPCMQPVGQDARERGLAHADGSLDRDCSRRLESGRLLGRRRRNRRHRREL